MQPGYAQVWGSHQLKNPNSLMHSIRPIAICLFSHDRRILVRCVDGNQFDHGFYRPIGGGVEFGERSESAVRREVREELGEEISQLRFVAAIENIFTWSGQLGHEIVFVYDGTFADASLYRRSEIRGHESDGAEFCARWVSASELTRSNPLVPTELKDILLARGLL